MWISINLQIGIGRNSDNLDVTANQIKDLHGSSWINVVYDVTYNIPYCLIITNSFTVPTPIVSTNGTTTVIAGGSTGISCTMTSTG